MPRDGPSGYFSSPQTLTRTAQKLADKGYLDAAGTQSVQQCIRAFHDNMDDEVLTTLQPHIPAGITDDVDAQYAVKELANIVSTSLSNYAKASTELERHKAAETIQAALVRRRAEAEAQAAEAAALDPVEERSLVAGGDSTTRRTVVFSRLSSKEKEKFMRFLVRNRVAFSKTGDEFVASIRLVPKKVDVPPNLHDDSSLAADDDAPPPLDNSRFEESLFGKRAARPPTDQARIVRAMAKNDNFDFDFADYPKFTALLSRDGSKQPRIRPLPWLLRIIEDVYEARFAFDKKRIASDSTTTTTTGGGGGGDGLSDDDRLSIVFPVFVIDFFSRKYGVRGLVDQNALDLLQSVHQFRDSFLEVEVFARFLETFYGPEDLLFFLYLRSILEKHLGKNYFRKRWNDLGPAREKLHESTWVSYNMSAQVCRLAFGDDPASKQHCADCLELVHKYSESIGKGDQAPRRIRVIHLLQLMLDQYHRSRPAQADGDSSAFLESQNLGRSTRSRAGNGSSPTTRIESKDEQDRLFREAERHYEEFSKSNAAGGAHNGNASVDSSDGNEAASSSYVQRAQEERQARIKAMEDRIRAEIASKRKGGGDSIQEDRDGPDEYDDDDNNDDDQDAQAAAAFEDEEKAENDHDRYNGRSTASLLQEIDQSIQTPAAAPPRSAGEDPRQSSGGGGGGSGGGDLTGLLDLLGRHFQSACNAEISRISGLNRDGLGTLPPTFVEMIQSEAGEKLQQKVEDIMQQLIDGSSSVDRGFASSFRDLQDRYNRSPGRARGAIQQFCEDFVGSMRSQLEDLFAGLVATAQDHARQSAAGRAGNSGSRAGGRDHSPHKIHISRRGSVNIELGN